MSDDKNKPLDQQRISEILGSEIVGFVGPVDNVLSVMSTGVGPPRVVEKESPPPRFIRDERMIEAAIKVVDAYDALSGDDIVNPRTLLFAINELRASLLAQGRTPLHPVPPDRDFDPYA